MSEEKRETKQALLGELESIKDLLSEDEWDDIPVLSDAVSVPASPQAAPASSSAEENLTTEPMVEPDSKVESTTDHQTYNPQEEEESQPANVDQQLDLMAAALEQPDTDHSASDSDLDNHTPETPTAETTGSISDSHSSDIDAAVDKLNLDLSLSFDETDFDETNLDEPKFDEADFNSESFDHQAFDRQSFEADDFEAVDFKTEDFTGTSSTEDLSVQEALDNSPSEDDFSEYVLSQATDSSEQPDLEADELTIAEDDLLPESRSEQPLDDSDQALEPAPTNPFAQTVSHSELAEPQAKDGETFIDDELLEIGDDDEEPLDSEKLDDDYLAEHVDEIEEELEHDLEELIHDLDALDAGSEVIEVVDAETVQESVSDAETDTDTDVFSELIDEAAMGNTVPDHITTPDALAVDTTADSLTSHNDIEATAASQAAELNQDQLDTTDSPIEIDSVANEAPSAIDEYQHDAFADLSPSDTDSSSLFSSVSQDYDGAGSDEGSSIEPLLDFSDPQNYTDEDGNPLPPGVLPGQQSLFSGAQSKSAITGDDSVAENETESHDENDAEGYIRPQRPTRATGENPFLPKHIRDRLHTNKALIDIIKESPLPPPAAARPLSDHVHETVKEQLPPQLPTENLHHIVEEVIALYMPRIEAELRERLLEEITRFEIRDDEVEGQEEEQIRDDEIEGQIRDDEES